MKFLTKERAKLGSAPGTIIQWANPVLDNDPDASQNVTLLPAGYLRCDGSIYSDRQYPNLARILGTGESSLYKKDGVTLLDDQFQVPDLGAKHIEASVSSNVGIYRNIERTTSNVTVQKAGVGIDVFSNVGDVATTQFNGVFVVPQQTFALNGNVGWTIPSTTETEGVSANAIGPHMHFSATSRVAVKEEPGFATTSRPYYIRPADANTPSPACNNVGLTWSKKFNSSGPNTCNNCDNFQESFIGSSQGEPGQWPTTKTITTMTAANWPNNAVVQVGNLRPLDVLAETGQVAWPTCRNTEEILESPPGSETNDLTAHSHRIDKSIGVTDYEADTDVGTIRPDGLTAEVSVRTSNAVKMDDVVSPFIVMEFLIKY